MGNNVQDDALYAAFKAKDTRFDGRFFVGISSTGVYCRPVCQARRAKRASCTFFSSAAEAELGAPVETGIEGLTRAFPTAADIAALGDGIQEQLGELGVIATRSACIGALAEALEQGGIQLDQSADPKREMEKLRAIRGIGGWTDAFLETDAGVKHALPGKSAKELLALAERWRPWRSYAVLNLWFKEDSRNAIYKHVSLPGGGNSFGLR